MKTETVNPNVSNFIKSLRDVGYTFEIAVADVLDNSITAKATNIEIFTVPKPKIILCMLDNGIGLTENQLTEAMRLATKNPDDNRDKKDLGRFGLGLKTASFSQCKKLTVFSKNNTLISIKQWDLDFIAKTNEWLLITPKITDYKNLPLLSKLINSKSGTLVVWEQIDRYKEDSFSHKIDKLREHLSLVFHRFLEGYGNNRKLKILINNLDVTPFDPFNIKHPSTLEKAPEKIKYYGNTILVAPFILPHHKNLTQEEWEKFSTEDGYIKSQGFYLYRANRLLIHGTWWGLHKATDAHKLVRIKIDISNNQDKYWGIDIKKSTAHPMPEIKKDLKRIINEVTKEGAKPFSKRGRKINDKTITRFWRIIPTHDEFHFGLNNDHPIYKKLISTLPADSLTILNTYLKGIEAYLPLETIQSQLQQNPYNIKQKSALTLKDIQSFVDNLKSLGLSQDYIESLLKTEIFKNNKELLIDE